MLSDVEANNRKRYEDNRAFVDRCVFTVSSTAFPFLIYHMGSAHLLLEKVWLLCALFGFATVIALHVIALRKDILAYNTTQNTDKNKKWLRANETLDAERITGKQIHKIAKKIQHWRDNVFVLCMLGTPLFYVLIHLIV